MSAERLYNHIHYCGRFRITELSATRIWVTDTTSGEGMGISWFVFTAEIGISDLDQLSAAHEEKVTEFWKEHF